MIPRIRHAADCAIKTGRFSTAECDCGARSRIATIMEDAPPPEPTLPARLMAFVASWGMFK